MNSILRLLLLLCMVISSPCVFASIAEELEQLRFNSENCVVPEKKPGDSVFAGGLCIDPESPPRYELNENRIQSQDIVNLKEVPTNFFWGDIHGVNYLTVSRNQHIPQYCGSCWAFGTSSAIGDRIKILRRNANPEINLAPQVLINCRGGGTCGGGYARGVYRYMQYNGLPDETCQNYQAKTGECKPNGYCENCTLFKKKEAKNECEPVMSPQKYYISEFGSASQDFDVGVEDTENANRIQAEIYARGPVACTIYATQNFDDYTGGIFSQFGFWFSANHIISLVGWGEEDGVKYWIGRNSWGTYWGEEGFFRIRRGDFFYSLGVENSCTFATPIIPDDLQAANPLPENVPYGEYLLKYHAAKTPSTSPEEVKIDPPEQDWLDVDEVSLARNKPPVTEYAGFGSYDIRNVTGVSYASVNRNQNNPRYCESSWAQAATSALNDRFALLRGAKFPEVVLSVQVLLNCIKSDDDPCDGGSPEAAYAFIKKNTIPDESCSPYEAKANKCTAIEICKNCWPPGCYAMKKGQYTPYKISHFGKISGSEEIMKEVSQNGPVVCKICYSSDFLSYTGGIYSEKGSCKYEGFVALSGWGKRKGKEYWIGRNSWGTYWGEDGGWFRVTKGTGDLGITDECYWATPKKPVYKYLESTPVTDHVKRELEIHTSSSKAQYIF